MKRFSAIATIFLLSVTVFFTACQSTKSSTASKMLSFNFENGKGYDYEMTVSMDQEIKGSPVKMDMNVYYSMDVVGDDGNLKTIRTKYDRFKMNMGVMGMNIDIDSDKPVPNDGDDKNPLTMMNRLFSSIKDKEFTMKINKEGKVVEVTGFKEIAQGMVESMGLDSADAEKAKATFSQQFNEKKVGADFERVLYIFPNKEVKVGDSWTKKSSTEGPQNMTYDSKYTVKEIEGDMVTLDEVSAVEGGQQGMNMKGQIKGTIVVDSRSGLVVSADQDMDMNMSGDNAFSMKMKSKVKGKAR
jgi:hypothetical protein